MRCYRYRRFIGYHAPWRISGCRSSPESSWGGRRRPRMQLRDRQKFDCELRWKRKRVLDTAILGAVPSPITSSRELWHGRDWVCISWATSCLTAWQPSLCGNRKADEPTNSVMSVFSVRFLRFGILDRHSHCGHDVEANEGDELRSLLPSLFLSFWVAISRAVHIVDSHSSAFLL